MSINVKSGPKAFVNPPRNEPQTPAAKQEPTWEGGKAPWGVTTNPIRSPPTKPTPAERKVNDAVGKLSTKLAKIHGRRTEELRAEDQIASVSAGKDAKGKPAIVVTMRANKPGKTDKVIAKEFAKENGFGKLPLVIKGSPLPRPAINPMPSTFEPVGPAINPVPGSLGKLATEPKPEQPKEQFGVDFPTHPSLKGKTDFA